jgi:hypothetical protein
MILADYIGKTSFDRPFLIYIGKFIKENYYFAASLIIFGCFMVSADKPRCRGGSAIIKRSTTSDPIKNISVFSFIDILENT